MVRPPSRDQRPLVLRLLVGERVLRREDRAELLAEEALAGEPRQEPAQRAPQDPLPQGRAGRVLDHRAVEQQTSGQVHLQRAIEVARHQLVRDRGPHVVGDEEHRPARRLAADQLLDQVRLPVQRVVVIPRLLGEAEAEEVGGQDRVVRSRARAAAASRTSWRESRGEAAGAGRFRPDRRRGCGGRGTPRRCRDPARRRPRVFKASSARATRAGAASEAWRPSRRGARRGRRCAWKAAVVALSASSRSRYQG